MRVLIADDDRVCRLTLERSLVHLGHEVLAAADGLEAWQLLESNDVQIVISDWTMPHVDGLELCRRIRNRAAEKYVYVIVLTVHEGKGHYLQCMEAGADDFFSKPVDHEVLQSRLRVACRILALQVEIYTLRGLIPICMYCKRIRGDDRAWSEIERYMSKHASVMFSHCVCPECAESRLSEDFAMDLRLDPKDPF